MKLFLIFIILALASCGNNQQTQKDPPPPPQLHSQGRIIDTFDSPSAYFNESSPDYTIIPHNTNNGGQTMDNNNYVPTKEYQPHSNYIYYPPSPPQVVPKPPPYPKYFANEVAPTLIPNLTLFTILLVVAGVILLL